MNFEIKLDDINIKDRYRINKKKLLDSEIAEFESFGVPDLSQNWLELFTPTKVSDLFEIMNTGSDNTEKAEYIMAEYEYYGFELVGLGTNILVLHNPAYQGVVYKFALDEDGIADNFNDFMLYPHVNNILQRERYNLPLAKHPTGIISVQERQIVMPSQERMEQFS